MLDFFHKVTTGEAYAWAAGIIDGEGCIATYLQPKGTSVFILTVSNNDPRMITVLHTMFDGRLLDFQPKGKRKRVFRWEVAQLAQIQLILTKIRPYLVIKGEEADIILSLNLGVTGIHDSENSARRFEATHKLKLIKSNRLQTAIETFSGRR